MLWKTLCVIERAVLPRAVSFRAGRERLDAELGGQAALVCPRIDGAFVVDDMFRREAPGACEMLRQNGAVEAGWSAIAAAKPELAANRDALLRLWARALLGVCSAGAEIEISVEARRAVPPPGLGFSAVELLAALNPHVASETATPAQVFYRGVRPVVADAWLFQAEGWPVAFPEDAPDLERVREMAEAASAARKWRAGLPEEGAPSMTLLMSEPQDPFLCVAVDKAHTALASGPNSQMGAALSAWRAAQQVREGGQTHT